MKPHPDSTQATSRQPRRSSSWHPLPALLGALALFLLGAGASLPLAAATADTLVTDGRSLLVEQELFSANDKFNAALALTPGHANANALAAVTRLLLLPQHPGVSNLLTRLGVMEGGRNIYNWTNDYTRDEEGNIVLPEDLASTEIIAVLRSNVLPALRASQANLARITSKTFLLSLTAAETTIDDVVVDYGDLQLLRAYLNAAEFFILTLNAHNLAARLDQFLGTNGLPTIQGFLDENPAFLTLNSKPDLAASKTALTDGIARYLAGSAFIRGRAPGTDRLFDLDESENEREAKFRTNTLPKISALLKGPLKINPEDPAYLNVAPYFSGAFSLRSLLPQFDGNQFVLGTLPDHKFGGVFTGRSRSEVEAALMDKYPYVMRDELIRPLVIISNPAPNARYTNTTETFPLTVSGSASDTGSGVDYVEYQWNGGSFDIADGKTNWFAYLNLLPGTNTIVVRAVDGEGNPSLLKTRSFVYVKQAPLTLAVTPGGRVTGATSALLDVGRAYRLTATPSNGFVFAGWSGTFGSGEKILNFTQPSTGAVETATFIPNPFPAVKGAYVGLFKEDAGARHQSAGYFSLMLDDRGGYSAALQFDGRRVPFSGAFHADGKATNTVTVARTKRFTLETMLDLSGTTDQIMGRVVSSNWTSTLLGDRAVFDKVTNKSPLATNYTVAILAHTNGVENPGGDSPGSVKITPAGVLTYSGTLADNAPAAQGTTVSKGGYWPLYLSLYGGKGSLISWVSFTNTTNADLSGDVRWFRPTMLTKNPYPHGFTNDTEITGSIYTVPTTNRVLEITNGVVTFTNGNLATSFSNSVTLGANNVITNHGGNMLVLKLTKSTGLVTGSVKLPGATRATPIKGVVLQKSSRGRGFFIGTTQSGQVILQSE